MDKIIWIIKEDYCQTDRFRAIPYMLESDGKWYLSLIDFIYGKSKEELALKAAVNGISTFGRNESAWCLDYKYSQEQLESWFVKLT